MAAILDTIAGYARQRVAADMARTGPEAMRELARQAPSGGRSFAQALRKPGMSFICEVKKASPSKGLISPDFPYLDIAREYETAGADCISCLTEPKWFLGSDGIFREIRAAVSLPMLRKDFVVDEYQIYQAKVLGADAVLLICALLDTGTIARYLGLCHDLGLTALVEAHDRAEIASAVAAGAEVIGVNNRNLGADAVLLICALLDTGTIARYLGLCHDLGLTALVEAHDRAEIASAVAAGAEVIGVNNRNLKDFSVDFSNAGRLRDLIPPGAVSVAESGVSGPADVAALRRIGADAVLMGEVLMRSADKGAILSAMREAAR